MVTKVELKELEVRPIASITKEINARQIPSVFPKVVMQLFSFLEKENISINGAPLAIFTDWKRGKGKIEVGIPVGTTFNSNGKVSLSQVPAGKAAYVLYVGKLRKIHSIYKIMKNWIKKNGYTYTNIWWEVYLTDPNVEPDQNKWETEVYLLVE